MWFGIGIWIWATARNLEMLWSSWNLILNQTFQHLYTSVYIDTGMSVYMYICIYVNSPRCSCNMCAYICIRLSIPIFHLSDNPMSHCAKYFNAPLPRFDTPRLHDSNVIMFSNLDLPIIQISVPCVLIFQHIYTPIGWWGASTTISHQRQHNTNDINSETSSNGNHTSNNTNRILRILFCELSESSGFPRFSRCFEWILKILGVIRTAMRIPQLEEITRIMTRNMVLKNFDNYRNSVYSEHDLPLVNSYNQLRYELTVKCAAGSWTCWSGSGPFG